MELAQDSGLGTVCEEGFLSVWVRMWGVGLRGEAMGRAIPGEGRARVRSFGDPGRGRKAASVLVVRGKQVELGVSFGLHLGASLSSDGVLSISVPATC